MSFFAGSLMGIYICQTSQIIFYFDDQKFITPMMAVATARKTCSMYLPYSFQLSCVVFFIVLNW